jgi:signal transduction histidine kinase
MSTNRTHNTLTVKGKLFFTFAVTLLLFLLFAALTASELINIRGTQITARTNAAIASKHVLTLRNAEQSFQISALEATLSTTSYQADQTNKTQAIEQAFKELTQPFQELIAYYRIYHPDTIHGLRILQAQLVTNHIDIRSEIVRVRIGPKNLVPLIIANDRDISGSLDTVQKSLTSIEGDITTRTQQVIDLTIALLIIISVCFIVVGTVLTYVMSRVINDPLKRLLAVTNDIANGNLRKRARITAQDEFGELGTSFNKMAQSLSDSIEELRTERTKLQASISSLSLGFVLVNELKQVSIINHAALHMLWPDIPLKNAQPITFDTMVAKLASAIDLPAIIDKTVSSRKLTVIDGLSLDERYFKFVVTPIMQDSSVIGSVILIDDITEAKVLERSKDEFFSIASHELRTPLTAIRGNMSMAKEYFGAVLKDPDLRSLIDDAHAASVRLIEIVNDFLDTSKLEQGKMVFTFAPVKLDRLIAAVTDDLQTLIDQQKNKVIVKVYSNFPPAYADEGRLRQVLYNLIGNANKYCEAGTITITCDATNKKITVHISDTGRGIAIENQKLLFHKFQQASSSLLTRDTTKGTGLGLYISKLIVERMNGVLRLERSEEGHGSTFAFTIPTARLLMKHIDTVQNREVVDTNTGIAIK